MKYLLVLSFIFYSANCFSQMTRDTEPVEPQFFSHKLDSLDSILEARVYIAKNSKAKTYHFSQTCRVIRHYRQMVVAVRESVAIQESYPTACHMCSK